MELKPGETLDAVIAERVMGRCPHPFSALKKWTCQDDSGFECTTCGKSDISADRCPRYSTDMKATWLVMEHMREHGSSVVLGWGEDTGLWECSWITGGERFTGVSASARLAICEAALKAVGRVCKVVDHA